jgi:glycosyltransferase involved in cell wall biosynthesis
MKVGIATVQVPFTRGGAEMHVEGLCEYLRKQKIESEIITMPFKWYPPSCILDEMDASRLLDVTEVNGVPIDLLITFKFPAYYFRHPNKVLWLLHQHRQAYDLYETEHGDLHTSEEGRDVAEKIKKWDNAFIPEHRALFSNSQNVADRLYKHNNLVAQALYPPPLNAELFHFKDSENFILAPGRIDSMKRQHLIIEAMSKAPSSLRLILIGPDDGEYADSCRQRVKELGINDRIVFKGVVEEEEKIDLFSRALAIYNGVFDEDLGYVTIESFLSQKPVITHIDSGGPLEFVISDENGFVVLPDPDAVAEVLHTLAANRNDAINMGRSGQQLVKDKKITWSHVMERLLS